VGHPRTIRPRTFQIKRSLDLLQHSRLTLRITRRSCVVLSARGRHRTWLHAQFGLPCNGGVGAARRADQTKLGLGQCSGAVHIKANEASPVVPTPSITILDFRHTVIACLRARMGPKRSRPTIHGTVRNHVADRSSSSSMRPAIERRPWSCSVELASQTANGVTGSCDPSRLVQA
jgi:hypothetical protein